MTTMHMKNLSLRQKNYRRRKKLMDELRLAFEIQKTYPEEKLSEICKKLFQELNELETNKGDYLVKKWKKK